MRSQALIGKVRAIYGTRLTKQDYDELMRKSSVSEICSYLKSNTRYSEILKPYNENTIHRGQLEMLIERDIFEMYVRLRSFEDLTIGVQIYGYLTTKIEIREILYCIRLINAGKTENYITRLPSYFLDHSSFNLIELAKASDMETLLEVLKGTKYHNVLAKVHTDENGKLDYTRCEVLLNEAYYEEILNQAKRMLTGSSSKELIKLIKLNVMLKNIITIYRLRIFFKEDAAEIKIKLIDSKNHENMKTYDLLANAENADDFFKRLEEIPYFKKHAFTSKEKFERNIHRIMYSEFEKQLRLSTKAAIVFFSMLSLYEFEKENLTTIIEGIRYGVPTKEIEELLVH